MIDWNRLGELREEVGEEDFEEVIDIFLDEVDEELGELPGLINAPDLEAKLHFLKGSALNIGLSSFAQLCQAGETLARAGDATSVDKTGIASCYQASKSELRATLNRISAA